MHSFQSQLKNSVFADQCFISLAIGGSSEQAFVLPCKPNEAKALWQAAVALLPMTQRWPVLSTCWSSGGSLSERLTDEDLFSRFYFEEESELDDVAPAAIIRAVKKVKLDSALKKIEREIFEDADEDISEIIDYELDATRQYCGNAPSADELAAARIKGKAISNRYEVERWLLDWECAHAPDHSMAHALQDFYEPDNVILVFLPTPHSWEALAYMSFYGRDRVSSACSMALCQRWHEQYGAQLYAHFGTMLEFFSASTPKTIDAAWALAKEHDLIASCTLSLPGISVRHYARALMQTNAWFLHERP